MPQDLDAAIYNAAVLALQQVPEAERGETYAVSFFVYDHEDDPRSPTLTFGTNTETQVRLAVEPPPDFEKPNPWWEPADPGEARWNYAFWKQNALAVFGNPTSDDEGAATVEAWVKDSGLWVDEPDDDDGWDDFEAAGPRITSGFVNECVQAARRLHEDAVVTGVFGRAIPIVIHELEYYDEIAEQTVAANPPGLADEFAAWVRDQ